MPYINQQYFRGGSNAGWYSTNIRTAGILNPVEIVLPSGTRLIRLHNGSIQSEHSDWWTSPHEFYLILSFYLRYLSAQEIKNSLISKTSALGDLGILHAASAIRRDWSGNYPQTQLSRFTLVKIVQPIMVFYGEGAKATSPNNSFVLCPEPIEVGGQRRITRQVCIPEYTKYKSKIAVKERCGNTDDQLFINMVYQHGLHSDCWEKSFTPYQDPNMLKNQREVDQYFDMAKLLQSMGLL